MYETLTFTGCIVSTHSRPKAAGCYQPHRAYPFHVSTHSRPKAAGQSKSGIGNFRGSFNTQPPEGGWASAPPQLFL